MNSRAYALYTGLFVLLLSAGVIIGALYFSGFQQQTKPYVVVSRGNVNGLSPQSKVSFRGIPAGKVAGLRFDPGDSRRILIDIDVDVDAPVTADTYAVIKLQGITGLSQLELDTDGSSTAPLATSAKAPATIPLRPSLIDRLSESGSQVVTQLNTLTASLNEVLNANNREHIAALLAQTDAAGAALVKLESDLDGSARRMPALIGQMQTVLQRIDVLTTNLDQLAKNADRLGATGQAAGEKINLETLPQLNAALARIGAAAVEMRQLADSLQRNPQQLLEGPQQPSPGPGERGYQRPSR